MVTPFLMLTFVLSTDFQHELEKAIGYVEGRREAEQDIAAGTMKFKLYGHLAGMDLRHDIYARRLRDKFDVEVVVVAFCLVTSRELGLWDGYNKRIQEELERRHGPGILAQVKREVTALWYFRLTLIGAVVVLAAFRLLQWLFRRSPTEVATQR